MDRDQTVEPAFAKELEALHRGLRKTYDISGHYGEERKKLFEVASRYVDELNKVRKYACPLSTNMLLSSIMESLLLYLILQHADRATTTRTWLKVATQDRQGVRIDPSVPIFHLAELIQLTDELKLLRTSGVQKKIDDLVVEYLKKLGFEGVPIALDRWDAKRNHELMHKLRGFRNAVHPLQVISDRNKNDGMDFVVSMWIGLRLLVLLNEMLGFRSTLT